MTRTRNLVLPKSTIFQTFMLVLFLLGTSLIAPLSAATHLPDAKPATEETTSVAENCLPAPPLKSNIHTLQFQLGKQLVAGGHLNIIEVSARLHANTHDFTALLQGDQMTVDVIIDGTTAPRNENWAIIEVVDNQGNIIEKYLVLTASGIGVIAEVEH